MYNDKQKRTELLLTLHEMVRGNPIQGVTDTELEAKLDLDQETFSRVALYLREEGFLTFRTFSSVAISHRGIKEVENIMAERYAENERRVLEAIADISRMSSVVFFPDLMQRLGMSDNELSNYCNNLANKNAIDFPGGDIIQMKPRGYDMLEPDERKDKGTTNIMNIQQNYGNAAIGSYINQTVNVNPEFDNAIRSLIELVQNSDLDNHDKEELSDEVVKVSKLAIKDSPTVVDRLNQRLDIIKTGLQGVNLLVAAQPHLEAIWQYFKIKYNL